MKPVRFTMAILWAQGILSFCMLSAKGSSSFTPCWAIPQRSQCSQPSNMAWHGGGAACSHPLTCRVTLNKILPQSMLSCPVPPFSQSCTFRDFTFLGAGAVSHCVLPTQWGLDLLACQPSYARNKEHGVASVSMPVFPLYGNCSTAENKATFLLLID